MLNFKKNETLKIIIFKTVIIVVIALALVPFVDWPPPFPTFYPTMKEAFESCSSENEYIGQVFFVDEHDENLTMLSWNESGLAMTHYLRNRREDGIWYACIATRHPGINLSPDPPGDLSWEKLVYLHNWYWDRNFRLYERLGRRPLYGISRKEAILDLSINDYNVEDVLHIFQTETGDINIYFWYFSDFPLVFKSEDEVIISFEAE